MIEKFYKNYIFLDLIEKKYIFLYQNILYNWIFFNISCLLKKTSFERKKLRTATKYWIFLEKLTTKGSLLNLNWYPYIVKGIPKYYWGIQLQKTSTHFIICNIFHFMEKYYYAEYIYYNINLWQSRIKNCLCIIKIVKLFQFSKYFKILRDSDYFEIKYRFKKSLVTTKAHISLILPFKNMY